MLRLLLIAAVCLFAPLGLAAEEKKPATKKPPKRRPQPAFVPIEDDPKLPRVLLIGDSISIAYTLPVRKQLAGIANVHRPPENCASTLEGRARLDRWLGQKKWDVIHFNWGLHDLKYMGPNGENLADPSKATSKQKVPIAEYRKELTALVQRLRRTGAKLIWRSTTPVPPGVRGRVPGDEVEYNRVALGIMKKSNIEVHDLWSWTKPRLGEIQLKANVHFNRAGSEQMASEVVARIKQALASRRSAVDGAAK